MKALRYVIFSIAIFLLFFLPGFISSYYTPVVKPFISTYNGPLIVSTSSNTTTPTLKVVTNNTTSNNYLSLDRTWKSK